MKQYKHHKLSIFRNVFLLLSVIAAVTVGGRLWKPAQVAVMPTAAAHERWQANYGKLPLSFEPNRGQAAKPVKFMASGDGYNLSLLANEAVLSLSKSKTKNATVRIKLVGANQNPQISEQESLRGKSNYLIGNDPEKWQTDVPTYAKVRYENVYPGVDAIFYGNQRKLEYDFIVAPGADPQAIRLDFTGAKSVRLDENGELILSTIAGEIRQHRPVIYQEINGVRQMVEGGYKLKGKQASFQLGAYDAAYPLIIDPVVSYATFLGEPFIAEEGNKDFISSMAVDAAGNVYLTGWTASASFPITFSISPSGEPLQQLTRMLHVTKLNATGSEIIYGTAISGTKGIVAGSTGFGIVVNTRGEASVGGHTSTTDFPTTPGAYRTTFISSRDDSADSFVLRLNAAGNALLASTLVGGSGHDYGRGLALDPSGNFCLVGYTVSTDFPNTDPTTGRAEPGIAAFVARVSADGKSLIHSNVLDAGGADYGKAITTNAAGNIYITGKSQDGRPVTNSAGTRFPRTQGSFQYPDVVDPYTRQRVDAAYIAKFSPSGQLIYSSVLGSAEPNGITLDRDGNPIIAGYSPFILSTGTFGTPSWQQVDAFPSTDRTTVQQDSPTFGPQHGGLMLLKLNAAGTNVLVSHRFGYITNEAANGVAVDAQGFIHVVGHTQIGFISPDGPVGLEDLSSYPYEPGNKHAYHLKFSPDGKTIAGVDFLRSAQAHALALDPAGNAYLMGWAGAGFQTTPGSLQTQLPQMPAPILYFIAKLGNAPNPGATPTPTPITGPTFTISGRVTTLAGLGVTNVSISLRGAVERSLTTGSDGRYSFTGVPQGAYTVVAAKSGTPFHPEQYVIETLNANKTADFITQPSSQSLANLSAASYTEGLAADSIVTAFGANLATTTGVAMANPLPTQLAGTSVKVRDALGVERLAPLFFVSPTQINYLTPPGTAAGKALITAASGNGRTSLAMVEVGPVAPGLFTADASGRGLASAVVFRVKANGEQSYEPVAVFDSSQGKMVPISIDPGPQGDQVFLLLFGTGFRNNSGMNNVTAQLGGIGATASFAGAQGGFAGLDQANVLLPRSLAGRGEVNLVLSVDGKAANTVKLWIK